MHREQVIENDRINLDKLPEEVRNQLMSNGLFTYGQKKVSFCGLIHTPNFRYIFTPRQSSDSASLVPDMFSAIRKYSEDTDRIHISENEGDDLFGHNSLDIIHSLLSDFRRNGLYSRRLRLNQKNTGKPNWSKTIKNFVPFLGSKGPVYPEYSGSKNVQQTDSEVSRIHAFIIRKLDAEYGSILFRQRSYREDGILMPQRTDPEYFDSVLKSELQALYSDRDIILINTLLSYVRELYGSNESNLIIGIRGFHNLWEKMLKSVLTNAVDINREFSIPTYRKSKPEDNNKKKIDVAKQKGQRTDIILHNKTSNTYAIIDAKYYDANSLTSAPGWGDLLKQFFYAKALKSIRETAIVKNFFIFPGTENYYSSAYMQLHNSEKADSLYDEITCIYISPNKVLNAYIEDKFLVDLSNTLLS